MVEHHGTFPPQAMAKRVSCLCWPSARCPCLHPISSVYLQEGVHLLLDPVHESPLDD